MHGRRIADMQVWWIGVMWFFKMSQNSICLAAYMGGNIVGRKENVF